MKLQTRKNFLYGVLAFVTALAVLLRTLDVFPAYIDDVIGRAAPVLLVILGLSLLLRNRIPVSDLLALVAGLALLGGIATTAFSVRQSQMRDDNRYEQTQDVSEAVALLRVRLQTLDTDVEVVRLPEGGTRSVQVRFLGSTESEIEESYIEDPDGSATYTLNELRQNPIPMLEDVGRGTLLVELPEDTPVDLQLDAVNGQVRLNMSNVSLERLNVNVISGDAIITLPAYAPKFSQPEETLGAWAVGSGALTVRVPANVSARFDMSQSTGGDPSYDPAVYNLLFGRDILEARNIDSAEIVMRYDLLVSRDRLTVAVPVTEETE